MNTKHLTNKGEQMKHIFSFLLILFAFAGLPSASPTYEADQTLQEVVIDQAQEVLTVQSDVYDQETSIKYASDVGTTDELIIANTLFEDDYQTFSDNTVSELRQDIYKDLKFATSPGYRIKNHSPPNRGDK